MRLIVTSDTHYHPRWSGILEGFIAQIASLKPDCFVIAGDVGEGINGYDRMLQLLQILDCPRLILTGNHDLWRNSDIGSQILWDRALPELTRQRGAIWLEGENWVSNGIGICGTNGWYDYSGCDPDLPYTDDEYWEMKRFYIVDGERVDWKWTDIEFARLIGDAFSQRLAVLTADSNIRQIIAVTHVPVFKEAILRKPADIQWNTSNAYFYNLTLGSRIMVSPKISRVFSGHTHIGVTAQVGTIQMEVIPSDYGAPAYTMLDL
jgi:hypothetical protein